jgi:hypothetical protein
MDGRANMHACARGAAHRGRSGVEWRCLRPLTTPTTGTGTGAALLPLPFPLLPTRRPASSTIATIDSPFPPPCRAPSCSWNVGAGAQHNTHSTWTDARVPPVLGFARTAPLSAPRTHAAVRARGRASPKPGAHTRDARHRHGARAPHRGGERKRRYQRMHRRRERRAGTDFGGPVAEKRARARPGQATCVHFVALRDGALVTPDPAAAADTSGPPASGRGHVPSLCHS